MTPSSVKLTVNFIKEHNKVVAHSPALDISTVGDSEIHAKKRFEELVHIFFQDITERKVIDEVLAELGWSKMKSSVQGRSQWVPPVITSVDLQVPIAA
jgi:hypothetical protein